MSTANIKQSWATDLVPSVTTSAPAGAQPVGIRVVRTFQEIEDIRGIWTSSSTPNADIDFYLLVCRTRPEIVRPHVIVLYRDGRPEAMLVGRLVQGTIDLSIGYKTILKIPARLLTVVYGGLLGNVSSENGKALVAEVSNALRRDEADAALFNFVRTDSSIYPFILCSPGPIHRDYFPAEHPRTVPKSFLCVTCKAT